MMSLMTVSCNSELDIEKHGNMGSMDTYYTTDDNVMTGTASLYLEVKSAYYNWFFVKNLLSDDLWCGGGQRGDNGEMEKLNEYSFDSNHGMIESLYKGFYGIIYKANLLIDKTEGESAVMKRAVNEAKVFRALGHFELVTLFGTAPVVDHLLTPDEYQQSNSTPEELWAIVEKVVHCLPRMMPTMVRQVSVPPKSLHRLCWARLTSSRARTARQHLCSTT